MTESQETTKKPGASDSRGTPGRTHPTDLVLVKDFKWIVIRRAWLWAFILVFLMGTFGLWSVHQNTMDDVNRAAKIQYVQDLNTCLAGNDSRAVLLDLVKQSTANAQAVKEDPSFPPALNAIIRQNKLTSADFEARAEQTLAPRDCLKLLKKP